MTPMNDPTIVTRRGCAELLREYGSLVVTPQPCDNCGGGSVAEDESQKCRRLIPCSSCGGSGHTWPEWATAALDPFTLDYSVSVEILDALAAAQEGDKD